MTVEYDRRGPVAVVSVDRPDRRNAIDDATAEALGDAWTRFDGDDDALVGVLTGTAGTFSAGATIPADSEAAFIEHADEIVGEQLD